MWSCLGEVFEPRRRGGGTQSHRLSSKAPSAFLWQCWKRLNKNVFCGEHMDNASLLAVSVHWAKAYVAKLHYSQDRSSSGAPSNPVATSDSSWTYFNSRGVQNI
ncbi:hypothetical protein V6N13_081572 [Hibiscus sabdariffa]|uniref:Uncharacterized protein n=1 Tax=Hibiscus sabdariffa TaxID=183260 RepID=A0ABR2DCK4_9ROSI